MINIWKTSIVVYYLWNILEVIIFEVKTYRSQECIPVGCVPPLVDRIMAESASRGGSGPGGGGVSGPGGSAPGGVCLVRGGGIPACTEAEPPPVDRITDACKNITLAQLRCGR